MAWIKYDNGQALGYINSANICTIEVSDTDIGEFPVRAVESGGKCTTLRVCKSEKDARDELERLVESIIKAEAAQVNQEV